MTQETRKITAVEWLQERYNSRQVYEESIFDEEFEQAKAMEKEQIVNADLNATIRTAKGFNADVYVTRVKELAEQYYNETFNK
jgi:hypothetical protein